MRDTVVMLLAGGGGTRLNILGHLRAKPAVPFGGMYRIIDFTLSNVMNSGITSAAVLTQYKPLSLMWHIGTGEPWDMIGRTRGVKILPPRTGARDSDWYRGTADAVRQNIEHIDRPDAKQVLILSGDHIYHMDYSPMIRFHQEKEADVTIATMPVPAEETRHFGIAVTDADARIVDWEEKPEGPARSDLASMGIYVFRTAYLLRVLREVPGSDFGHHIIPVAMERDRVFAYPFHGYWKDVGTLQAYWEANRDLLWPDSGIDLSAARIRTNLEEAGRLGDRPPARIGPAGRVADSLICPGSIVEGEVVRSILSPGVRVAEGARVIDSVVMHDTRVGKNAVVERAIIDKAVRIGDRARLGGPGGGPPNREFPEHLHTGLVVVGKGAAIPADAVVGTNSILYPFLREDDFHGGGVDPGGTLRGDR